MIEYITGEVTDLTPRTAVVECMGIGYLLDFVEYLFLPFQKGQSYVCMFMKRFGKMPISFMAFMTVTNVNCSYC